MARPSLSALVFPGLCALAAVGVACDIVFARMQQPVEVEPVEQEQPPVLPVVPEVEEAPAPGPCEGFVQPGCVQAGCPEGQVCQQGPDCVPSLCTCDPVSGETTCSLDCGGGRCVDAAEQCQPLACRLMCPFGFLKDDRGCALCECAERPRCGCEGDEDCIKAVPGCCPCSNGGAEMAIAAACAPELAQCPISPGQVPCLPYNVCSDRVPACVGGECVLQNPI